jgi:plasmid replication initiation protein
LDFRHVEISHHLFTQHVAEINKKTDLHLEIKSLKKLGTRVDALNFSIITQEIPNAKPIDSV